ncbi:GAF domain-containing protein [Brochothrix campestris]|uniref:GAF domain-containing protein n=1 Tax=Brochothrix campestris FSL F6-1037 TaxID=1265861 RepID=W7D4A0_9LIST|nr:GAF domain-containing protein [Brochothrix campestris]EUJ40133.1 hypothetical protein BCAMP_05566 [Brochothrix campestris FSL F6-1037]
MSDIKKYERLVKQTEALLFGETNLIANMSNLSALLNETLENINWVGFYLYENEELILGPFQGKVACVHIPIGKGVCGTAAQQRESIVVVDVHQFPGHIACDSASQSEIVIPIIKEGQLIGVLDIDSPVKERFSTDDQHYLEQVVRYL